MSEVSSMRPKYPGIRITTNGNQLVSLYTEARLAEAGVFYPITPSTEMGENFQMSYANGELNVFGDAKIAIETEGEHAAQGGAIAVSVGGKRVVNFTSSQGVVYGLEQYYHAPGKLSTMVLEVGARALTKSALNVHCSHDDVYACLDTGWTMLFAKDAQQASDQAMILRKVNEKALTPGINIQDGFLTSHLERTFLKPEAELIREYLGHPGDTIECPTEAQRELFGPTRRRVPEMLDLKAPVSMGPVQNQEHYMNGVIARRNNFIEPILGYLEEAYAEFAELTGREYGLISEYKCEEADTVFIALGSAAENMEAASDYIYETRGERFGVVHVNVIRPFPEAAIINAVKGKKRIIVLERTDEQMSTENPLTKDIRTALAKAQDGVAGLPELTVEETPRIFSGVYGLGSRDFRPEGIIGAYEFATGKGARQDGKTAADGVHFFYVGVDHPYAVIADETPSCLPENAMAIRMHSIGGWGMITTGKNLSEIIGEFSQYIAKRDDRYDADSGQLEEVYHVSANPKYGSEKKGAPTNYFLVAAPERIRVNCDLQHVTAVLCCDPKAFTHSNPLAGLSEGAAFVMESDASTSEEFWSRIPAKYRQEIIDKKIRLYGLPGFSIAREATDRPDLQFRMQGNAFLGAFFKVSPFLGANNIPAEEFKATVEAQYNKKFGRFGAAVVQSNMKVMTDGFDKLREFEHGVLDAEDRSAMIGTVIEPCSGKIRFEGDEAAQPAKAPIQTVEKYDSEFRAGLGYHQPASALAATGTMPANGAVISKYVSRRKVPIYNPDNCTNCMACIEVCPDTALPVTVQDVSTILETAFSNYVSDASAKELLLGKVADLDAAMRAEMNSAVADKACKKAQDIFKAKLDEIVAADEALKSNPAMEEAVAQANLALKNVPLAYYKTRAMFANIEKKQPGEGGLFSIFVSDLCKGCGECVVACGDKKALHMVDETEDIYSDHISGVKFLDLLKDTDQKYLGKFDAKNPQAASQAVLKNYLLLRSNYEALLSGDGACAGCGEKTVLRAVSTLTEAYMRPLYHAKSDRLNAKAAELAAKGKDLFEKMQQDNPEAFKWWSTAVKHLVLDMGGENEKDSLERIEKLYKGEDLVEALAMVLKQDAFNHKGLRAVDGRGFDGMCTMAMTAHTGCNSVYSSTHPNNPHPYPWMNSLFQDGVTIGWLWGENLIVNHSKRSVIPERLVDVLLNGGEFTHDDYFMYTHFSDTFMTDLEVAELPKVWAVGGDGGIGDIGFQNLSKVVLQNRPNVGVLLVDTQVYSNTGGQNSDSSMMPGGFDMNQHGAGSTGKLTERKEVAAIMMNGHGSPFVTQGSIANAPALFKSIVDGLAYRGMCYLQAYTSCQPEHGIPDDGSATHAGLARDSRGFPEFYYNPTLGESYEETLSLKGNPNLKKDWAEKKSPEGEKYNYTTVHWAATEPRFRKHFFKVKELDGLVELNEKLKNITQQDVVYRRYLDKNHRSYIPEEGIYTMVEQGGKMKPMGLSRHLVLWTVERRKNWRLLQSRAGIQNEDYQAQKEYLKELDAK